MSEERQINWGTILSNILSAGILALVVRFGNTVDAIKEQLSEQKVDQKVLAKVVDNNSKLLTDHEFRLRTIERGK